ncbi:MAG: hypothetical protein LJE90_13770, partial [Betaproteobacteria bacterium]|nr:hypothetical protein [Betaproteobacteria bacterium]
KRKYNSAAHTARTRSIGQNSCLGFCAIWTRTFAPIQAGPMAKKQKAQPANHLHAPANHRSFIQGA